MTRDEGAILSHLTSAWDAFVALTDHHPDDIEDFRRRIHALQDQLMARPTRRSEHMSEIRNTDPAIMNMWAK
ncbi:MAG TPA: hypothetical protein ENH55_10470 [Aurantimonas coralicida]|uniref:Uncharacterized protein n=2 Tax=root TaxID=1 RepID=A0A9C9NI72_9HYPH|nr:hypothetical protein [Aurantimonas coralicida]HEU01809.1 hypothetical protein [Aurantimonas coralicida]